MRTVLFSILIIGLCLSGCKKEETNEANFGSIPYHITAPTCLLLKVNNIYNVGQAFSNVYKYDNQKRIIAITVENKPGGREFRYEHDKMIEIFTTKNENGKIVKEVLTHYLNAAGMISKTVRVGGMESYYEYDVNGYRVREIGRWQSINYVYGVGYQYVKGNMIASYQLKVDSVSLAVTDSVLERTYEYYPNLPGKLAEANSWIWRNGRGSKNELKSSKGSTSTTTYEYSTGGNSLPMTSTQKFPNSTAKCTYEWNCN